MLGREMNMGNLTLAFVLSVLCLRDDSCPTGALGLPGSQTLAPG